MEHAPDVSVIVPAFQAHSTIQDAIASVSGSGIPPDRIEVVVAPDDGTDYAGLLSGVPFVRCLPPGPVRSGPGATRNRALAAAKGAYVAFLDADDAWEPGYLSQTLPLARTAGAAFAPTSIREAGTELMRLPGGAYLDFDTMAETGASFHPIVQRHLAGPFSNRTAQDIFHACEVLAQVGGRAPVGGAAYCLNLTPDSETRRKSARSRLRDDYRAYVGDLESGKSRCPEPMVPSVVALFRAKLRLDRAFRAQRATACYYTFIASLNVAPANQSQLGAHGTRSSVTIR